SARRKFRREGRGFGHTGLATLFLALPRVLRIAAAAHLCLACGDRGDGGPGRVRERASARLRKADRRARRRAAAVQKGGCRTLTPPEGAGFGLARQTSRAASGLITAIPGPEIEAFGWEAMGAAASSNWALSRRPRNWASSCSCSRRRTARPV